MIKLMSYLLTMVIFNGYVKQPEGIFSWLILSTHIIISNLWHIHCDMSILNYLLLHIYISLHAIISSDCIFCVFNLTFPILSLDIFDINVVKKCQPSPIPLGPAHSSARHGAWRVQHLPSNVPAQTSASGYLTI